MSNLPAVGKTFDISHPGLPQLGAVRVKVVGADEQRVARCGCPLLPVLVVSGFIVQASPNRILGPGEPTFLSARLLQNATPGGAA